MRIAMMVIRNILIVPYFAIKLVILAKKYDGDYREGFQHAKKISLHAIKSGNIEAEFYGIENIPDEDGFIMYPNHQGLFDTLMFFASSPKPLAFVIKKEAASIVFLRRVIQATGSLSIDREDMRQSMKVINQMADEVKEGRNYVIFPEGTRSRLGNQLLEFKAGSFKAAQKAKCPIVPCALVNSYVPFDENSIRKVTVKLIYLPMIPYEEYKDMRTNEIAAMVKSRIEAAIAEHIDV